MSQERFEWVKFDGSEMSCSIINDDACQRRYYYLSAHDIWAHLVESASESEPVKVPKTSTLPLTEGATKGGSKKLSGRPRPLGKPPSQKSAGKRS